MLATKKLRRKYLPECTKMSKGEVLVIRDKNFHHLVNVLRLRSHSKFRIFNNMEEEYLVQIIELTKNKKNLKIRILENITKKQTQTSPSISLALSLINRKKFLDSIDFAIQLNIKNIYPIVTLRSQLRDISISSLEDRIIRSTEQCERLDIAAIYSVVKLQDLLYSKEIERMIFVNENETEMISKKITSTIDQNLLVIIGPEGGFTDEEAQLLRNSPNVVSVSLGTNTLTTELATAAVLSYLNFLR